MLISGALYLHGLDDAIAGASDCGKIIYDYKKVVSIFEKQGMTLDEAVEWVDWIKYVELVDKSIILSLF